jgi:hypothetical protein
MSATASSEAVSVSMRSFRGAWVFIAFEGKTFGYRPNQISGERARVE